METSNTKIIVRIRGYNNQPQKNTEELQINKEYKPLNTISSKHERNYSTYSIKKSPTHSRQGSKSPINRSTTIKSKIIKFYLI
jgi:hypothetical protein